MITAVCKEYDQIENTYFTSSEYWFTIHHSLFSGNRNKQTYDRLEITGRKNGLLTNRNMFRQPSRIRSCLTKMVWLLICLCLFAPAGHATGNFLVFCIGTDGHAMLESESAGTCTAMEHSSPGSIQTGFAAVLGSNEDNASHCGPCTDLVLYLGFLKGQPDASIKTTSLWQICLFTSCRDDISIDLSFLIEDSSAGGYSTPLYFDPLHSVRLLI